MWSRSYLLLLLVRTYFTFSPSYLHPDENFQGPEVIAGELFSYPAHKTWEWTSSNPIRSVFPLWPVYGIPMSLLKWIWTEDDQGQVSPEAIYYILRIVMSALSLLLEDWAIYELVHSPRHRQQAAILVASSYVTWTYQSHTFSNSIETLLVVWGLVQIQTIVGQRDRPSILSCSVLSFIFVCGVFNRVTYPAFLVLPSLQLLPHFFSRPTSLLSMIASAIVFIFLAIATDTAFYQGLVPTSCLRVLYQAVRTSPVITPWNSIRYNARTSNLALHGLHQPHQHFLINLPQLLGPALIPLLGSIQLTSTRPLYLASLNSPFLAAVTGTFLLSIFPHQEPRFLLPCVPLLLTCIRLPASRRSRIWFWTSWLTFNILLGTLMGVYHQGGVIPAQLRIPEHIKSFNSSVLSNTTSATIFWWKTYPPPTYLLGHKTPCIISTVPLMGLRESEMLTRLSSALPSTWHPITSTANNKTRATEEPSQLVYLIAPLSSRFFPFPSAHARHPLFSFTVTTSTAHNDITTSAAGPPSPGQQQLEQVSETVTLELTLEWSYTKHINLDDIDIGEEGIWGTLARVVGRRGIGIWKVQRLCQGSSKATNCHGSSVSVSEPLRHDASPRPSRLLMAVEG